MTFLLATPACIHHVLTIVTPLAHGALGPARVLLAEGYPDYRFRRPFLQPMPVWDYWPWLLLPLCVGVAIVYKSIKCRRMREVPKEATVLTLWILAGMIGAAGVLLLLVKVLERAQS